MKPVRLSNLATPPRRALSMAFSGLPGSVRAPLHAVLSGTAAATGRGAREASLQTGRAAAAAGRGAREASLLAGRVAAAAEAVADLGPRRTRRRIWSTAGRAHIEVRGLTGRGPGHRRLADDVTSALTRLKGVRWAEMNAVTAQVLVDFDEADIDLAALIASIEAAEEALGADAATFSWSAAPHPADDAPVFSAAAALAADALGIAVAASSRLLRITPLPRSTRAPLVLVEAQPRLRRAVAARFGPVGGDLLVTVGNAITHGLSEGPAPLAVDGVHRLLQLGELRSRRAVWAQREQALHSTGHALPARRREPGHRPAPLPPGPVESVTDKISLAALIGAGGILAWTGDPGQAASTILATVPKAARLGREGFAAMLGVQLARRGVVPLDGSALRRLDRVTAVLIDSTALCTPRARILAVAGEETAQDARAWQAAEHILDGRSPADLAGSGPWARDGWRLTRAARAAGPAGRITGPSGLLVNLVDDNGRHRGAFLAGCELDPRAEAVLGAARGCADHLVLTAHASTADLATWADEILPSAKRLPAQVRRMQAHGHGVLVVSDSADDALAAADVGIAVLTPAHGVCWSADLICGPGLAEVWRVLRAAGTARKVSERSARLSIGGSTLGALLVAVGRGQQNTRAGVAPVQSAALLAIVAGAASARSVGREDEPAAAPRGAWHALTADGALQRLLAARAPAPDSGTGTGATTETGTRSRAGAGNQAGPVEESAAPGSAAPGPLAAGPFTAGLITAGRPITAVMAGGRAAMAAAVRSRPISAAVISPARGVAELSGAVREELQDPLTPVLALGTMASAVVGSGVDAALVASVMAGNALISGAQRMRAERALRQLLLGEQPLARRVRWAPAGDLGRPGGRNLLAGLADAPQQRVLASDLVPGDIIALRPADVGPADGRLLLADDLEVDESTLTGESLPVSKTTEPAPGAPLAERACMIYEGSTILAGSGHAVVVATGGSTEAGRAATAAGRAAPPAGIQARLAELTRISVPASGLGGLAVAGLGLIRGVPLRQAVASGVAVAVAAVPEGLPLVATVAQLAAARRLSGTGVLVRSSRALEALGRVDIICFDKTGTLTEGRLAVTRVASAGGDVDLGRPQAVRLLRIAARACPQVAARASRTLVHATDRAVVDAARARGGADRSWRLADELPFETSRGYAASLGETEGVTRLAVKGAPEVVLARCSRIATQPSSDPTRQKRGGRAGPAAASGRGRASGSAEASGRRAPTVAMTAARRAAARTVLNDLAAQGLRVLAVAEADLPGPAEQYRLGGNGEAADLVGGLTLTGFLGIADTPRPSARETVRRLSEAGVRVAMITGDHPGTALAVAHKLGIPQARRVLTGAEISRLPEARRIERINASTVFARVSPEQKVRIVQALQRAGHVVAMAGDGSNDAAAIRLADVGIGVTGRGSRSATGAADLVLTGPDTGLIVDALLEGRALWTRVMDAVSILVGGNAGEVAFTLLGTALTGRSPLSTRQLLLVNTLTDMLPALAVALAPARRGSGDDRLAAGPVGSLLGPELARSMAIRGGATALGATVAWQVGRMTGRQRRASTMGLATLVLTQLGQTLLTSGRSPLVIATSTVSAAVLVGIVETPGVSHFFGSTPLGPAAWAIVAGSAAGATLAAALAPRCWPAAGQ